MIPEFLLSLDEKVLYFINHTLSNPVFDRLMPVLRNKLTWIPLYAVVIYFIVKKYRWKSIYVIGFALLAVVVSDQLSSGLIKPLVQRLRPCNNPELAGWIKLPIGPGSGWSFLSSHAANHFALAVYFIQIFIGYKEQYKIRIPFLLWASSIAFAQVYIGFHYPSDVIAGGLLGCLTGFGMARLNCLVICYRSGHKL